MPARKKSTRRNTGGHRTVTPPPYYFGPSAGELEREMRMTNLAMDIARRYVGRFTR